VDALERLRRAGFARIELHANRPALEFHEKSLVRGIARWFLENGLPRPSLHLPFQEEREPRKPQSLSVADPSFRERGRAIDEIKRCLEFADHVELDYVVLHLGVPQQLFNPVVFDYAFTAVQTIQSFAGCRVLIENIDNQITTTRRVAEFKAAAQLQNIGFCYDTGHADDGNSFEAAAMHLNDNDGSLDDHRLPFEGRMNWPGFVDKLVATRYDGPLILEIRDDRVEKAWDCRSRLLDLVSECRHSPEEFRLKYKLLFPDSEDVR
jgi:sugar phosphate isomerase/epimerase